MVGERALRGYLLEEVIGWLLRSSGYRLLSDADEQALPPERRVLKLGSNGLVVRGRGAWHQADALGQFSYVPPFSLPVRLFTEAKFNDTRVGLGVVRNGHGVVHDVNENVVVPPSAVGPTRPWARYRYSYAIFSTSGFSREATEYALAHQISLVDLSMPDFGPLREHVRTTANRVHTALAALPATGRPGLHSVRGYLRRRLQEVVDDVAEMEEEPTELPTELRQPFEELVSTLSRRSTLGLVLAFPAAPFVLGLASDDLYAFVDYCCTHPTHSVRLRRLRQAASHPVWELRSAAAPDAYTMTFSLPSRVEAWIVAQAEAVRARTVWIKQQLLSGMTIYWMDGDQPLTFCLRYETGDLRQP
jgi:hypothetical protein